MNKPLVDYYEIHPDGDIIMAIGEEDKRVVILNRDLKFLDDYETFSSCGVKCDCFKCCW